MVNLYGQSADMDPISKSANASERQCSRMRQSRSVQCTRGNIAVPSVRLAFIPSTATRLSQRRVAACWFQTMVHFDRTGEFLSTQARDLAPHYQHGEIGYNYRMSNILAGVGRDQLTVLEDRVRGAACCVRNLPESVVGYPANRMDAATKVELFQLLADGNDDLPVIAGWKCRADWRLAGEFIEARPVWKPMHQQPVFAGARYFTAENKSVSDDLFEHVGCACRLDRICRGTTGSDRWCNSSHSLLRTGNKMTANHFLRVRQQIKQQAIETKASWNDRQALEAMRSLRKLCSQAMVHSTTHRVCRGRCREVPRRATRVLMPAAWSGFAVFCRDRSRDRPGPGAVWTADDRACREWVGSPHERQQLGDIVAIGAGQDHRKRDALRFRDEMVLEPGRARSVGWVPFFLTTPAHRMEEESTMTRDQSIRSAARNCANSSSCSRFQTPASCQARSRRQQLIPEPHPISWGQAPGNTGPQHEQDACQRLCGRPAVCVLRTSYDAAWAPAATVRSAPTIRLSVSVWPSPPPRETRQRLTKEIRVNSACGHFVTSS